MSRSNIVDVEVHVHHRTEKAVLVSDDGSSEKAVWVPLSMCEICQSDSGYGAHVLTLEQWLAEEKGLV